MTRPPITNRRNVRRRHGTSQRVQMVCKVCESADVTSDAIVTWDTDRQEWVAGQDPMDDGDFCNTCNRDRPIVAVDIRNWRRRYRRAQARKANSESNNGEA